MATPDVPLKGKAEDAPHTSGDVGVAVLAKRTDSSAVSAGTDGDYATLNVDALGRLWVHASSVDPGTGAANLGKAEDAPHASGDLGVEMLAVRQDVLAVLAANGDYIPLVVDATGKLWTNASMALNNAGVPLLASAVTIGTADGLTPIYFGPAVEAWNRLYNGVSFDNERANTNVTVLASAARTATPTKVDQTNHNAMSLILVIDVTAGGSLLGVVFTIQGKDPLSGKYYTILASAAITAVGTTVLRVDPNGTAAANLVAHDVLPRIWAVNAVHGDGDSITYSVGALLVRG